MMQAKHTLVKGLGLSIALLVLGLLVMYSFLPTSSAQTTDAAPAAQEGVTDHLAETAQFEIAPEFELPPHARISPAESKRLYMTLLRVREETAASYNVDTSAAAEAAGNPNGPGVASTVSDAATEFHGTPGNFVIPSNAFNNRANLAGNSTLAEPAAANEGPNIFYAGNFGHNEFSTNGGAVWNNVVVPAGPADAPTVCCDWDVVYDQARGVTFISTLYINAAATNGVVRIFVRRDISLANNCSYTIDPAGASDNTLADYPHINLSNDFLYLTTNNVGGAAGNRAQVRRFNIDQMADCVAAGGTVFSYLWPVGQRVFVPVEGARETMYWGMHEDFDTMRVFSWNETAAGPVSVLQNVAASSFGVDEDCTGGVGAGDWWSGTTALITGFRHRGAVGHGRIHFYWNVASDAAHTQGHIHGAIFAENTVGTGHSVGALIAQPVIFNNEFCFGYPIVSANERGDIGMVLAHGGNLGAGGNAAQSAVGIDDDFTAALGTFGAGGGANFTTVAVGTHNRLDGRFGDYFTIHPHEPCDLFFNATAYALNGGTAVNNVNARYVEFGRQRDHQCYIRWDDEDPTP